MWAWILYVTQYVKWAAATADVLLNHYVFTRPENVLSLPHCWCCLANFMNIPLQRLQMYLDSWFVLEHLFDRRSFSFPSPVAHFTLCVGTYLIITSLSSSCDVPEHFDLYVTYHLHLQPNPQLHLYSMRLVREHEFEHCVLLTSCFTFSIISN